MKPTKQSGFLNRNQLKYLVIAAMLIDHIAWAFVPLDSLLGQVMHFIGRLTGPTMAYFVAEGYHYTRNVKKYALRLGVFALLSWIPFVYFEYGTLPIVIQDGSVQVRPYFGVLYTLLLGLLAIWLWDKGKCPKLVKILGIIGLCALSIVGDWPVSDVLYCLFLYIYRKNPREKWTAFCIITAVRCMDILFANPWWAALFRLGIFMVPLLIQFCYNGESGSKKPVHKWFFYVFYPAHLLVLGLLKWMVLA
ncbi:TraX family protein [uncultured Ruminococcus sp.]|uniref:TraX family protein n=1 Tax=uncultured Ruminococcus sp. TaxID=165186 RepID=UPI00261F01C3|nr:TraX family protein [uncultured Ruminococcus sp.]